MIDRYLFKTQFSDYFSSFVEMKIQQGNKDTAKKVQSLLRDFEMIVVEKSYGKSFIDKYIYECWHHETVSVNDVWTVYWKTCYMINVLKYMCHMGMECYIPPKPKVPSRRYTPNIYSKEELDKIFIASDRLSIKGKFHLSNVFIMPSLIRLLYSTSIRIGEALSIKNDDLYLDRGYIIIRQTKNRREKIAPINNSMKSVLADYLNFRNQLPVKDISAPDNYLFVTGTGRHCAEASVRCWFDRILKEAGLEKCATNHRRLHDLRHTACIDAFRKLSTKGRDLYSSLPIISAFMGHKSVYDTEYYLRLTKDMYPETAKLDTSISQYLSKIAHRSLIISNKEYE